MQGFYEAVQRADLNQCIWSVTVIEGIGAGQKALWCNGQFLWKSEGGFFSQDQHAIEAVLKGEEGCANSLKPEGRVSPFGECSLYCEQLRKEAYLVICGGTVDILLELLQERVDSQK